MKHTKGSWNIALAIVVMLQSLLLQGWLPGSCAPRTDGEPCCCAAQGINQQGLEQLGLEQRGREPAKKSCCSSPSRLPQSPGELPTVVDPEEGLVGGPCACNLHSDPGTAPGSVSRQATQPELVTPTRSFSSLPSSFTCSRRIIAHGTHVPRETGPPLYLSHCVLLI